MYSGWYFLFAIIALVVFVSALLGIEAVNYDDVKFCKALYMIFCFISSAILFVVCSKEGMNWLAPPRSEYLTQASCSMSNENYTIFKTEHGEYKVEGIYEYGKDYILLMEDENGRYFDDKVLNIYSSDINLLLEENETKE